MLVSLMSHSPSGRGGMVLKVPREVVCAQCMRNRFVEEAHGSCYSIHPGSTKMYHDFKEAFLWDGLKRT